MIEANKLNHASSSEDKEIFSNAGDSITVIDYMREQQRLEIEARTLLPYSPDVCTFSKGPLRQSVFWCRTCSKNNIDKGEQEKGDSSEPAGICYTCSILCHGSHDLVELFEKRNFTCDCPTVRIPFKCTKSGTKYPSNQNNSYNHNFKGLFCHCNEAYDIEQETRLMIQCLSCEDWFHGPCIKGTIPDEDSFEYFICRECVCMLPWMREYIGVSGILGNFNNIDENSDKEYHNADDLGTMAERDYGRNLKRKERTTNDIHLYLKRKIPKPDEESAQLDECEWKKLRVYNGPTEDLVLFLPKDFRDCLCTCVRCIDRSSSKPYLYVHEDTYSPPRSRSLSPVTSEGSKAEAEQRALSALPREKALEGIRAYIELKDKLTSFLQPYAEGKKIVCAEDIHVSLFFFLKKKLNK